ncbi:hypothetical protein D3C73_1583240 [compost metagenome]
MFHILESPAVILLFKLDSTNILSHSFSLSAADNPPVSSLIEKSLLGIVKLLNIFLIII